MEFVIGLGIGTLVGVMVGVWLMGRHTVTLAQANDPVARRTLALLMIRCQRDHRYLSVDVTAHRRRPTVVLALGRFPLGADPTSLTTVAIEGPYWQTVEAAHTLLDDWASTEL